MRKGSVLVAALAIAVQCGLAQPHHSIATFDGRQTLELKGTVSRFHWINPHASIEIDVDALPPTAAIVGRWIVEMTSPNTLMSEGWKRDTIAAGDRITLFAHPQRQQQRAADGSRRALYRSVVLPDGKALGAPRD